MSAGRALGPPPGTQAGSSPASADPTDSEAERARRAEKVRVPGWRQVYLFKKAQGLMDMDGTVCSQNTPRKMRVKSTQVNPIFLQVSPFFQKF